MKRYVMDLSQEFVRSLDEVARRQGTNKAGVIQNAVASYKYLKQEEKAGNNVVIRDKTSNAVILQVKLP
jgi:hypothetical protein